MFPWGIVLLIVAEIAAVVLTIRDPGFESRSDAVTTSALWLIAAGGGLSRAFFDSRVGVNQIALAAAIMVFSIIIGTGARPGLILGSSVECDGRIAPSLLWRRRIGWASGGLSLLGAAVWIEFSLPSS